MKLKIWGCRGSVPSWLPPEQVKKFGNRTTCYEIIEGNERIIIDAGTGIIPLGNEIMKQDKLETIICLSHLHWDHIQGLPFFVPLYVQGFQFRVYGRVKWDKTLEEILQGQMSHWHFPISLKEVSARGAEIKYIDFYPGGDLHCDLNNLRVHTLELNHPGGCIGYKITSVKTRKTIVILTDNEHRETLGVELEGFLDKANIILWDGQYTTIEEHKAILYKYKHGWGHSTGEFALRKIREKIQEQHPLEKLIITHHDPSSVDEILLDLEETLKEVRELISRDWKDVKEVIFARDNMEVEI